LGQSNSLEWILNLRLGVIMFRRAHALAVSTALLLLPLLQLLPAPAHAQSARIRVVDEPTRLGVAHAIVSLVREGQQGASTTTDTLGFATVSPPQPIRYSVRVSALGYIEQTREIDFGAESLDNIPAFTLTPAVLTLSPIEVEVQRSGYRSGTTGGFVRSSQIMAGSRIAEMRTRGFMLEHAIRQISGLRIRYVGAGRLCVESTRRSPTFRRPTASPACRMVTVVVNDFPYFNAPELLANSTLDNVESVHYLSPTDAGFRYGMEAAQNGALILWTRGRGPYKTRSAWIPIRP
jgi:hypothetical protein